MKFLTLQHRLNYSVQLCSTHISDQGMPGNHSSSWWDFELKGRGGMSKYSNIP